MEIKELVAAIALKHKEVGIILNLPATSELIKNFEKNIGFSIPADFKEFYSVCNGFECIEDIFIMTPLEEIIDDKRHLGKNWFYFSEYMTFSDMWGVRISTNGQYEIFDGSYPKLTYTSSLHEFLEHYLEGDVFDTGGLYEWRDELKTRQDAANTGFPKYRE